MRRAIKINGTDTELDIGSHTSLKIPHRVFYLEEIPGQKTWRLTQTYGLIPDLTQIKELRFKHKTKKIKEGTVTTLDAVEIIDKEGNVVDTWEIEVMAGNPNNNGICFINFDAKIDPTTDKVTWRLMYYTKVIPNIAQCTGLSVVFED